MYTRIYSSHRYISTLTHGLSTLNPSRVGAAALLKLYTRNVSVFLAQMWSKRWTYVVALLPRSSGTEACAYKCGPSSSLEQEDGEDDTKGGAEGGSDEESAEAVVPLQ